MKKEEMTNGIISMIVEEELNLLINHINKEESQINTRIESVITNTKDQKKINDMLMFVELLPKQLEEIYKNIEEMTKTRKIDKLISTRESFDLIMKKIELFEK